MRPLLDEPTCGLKLVSIYSPTRLAIIEAIRQRPGSCVSDVARAIGKHVATVQANLHVLRKARILHTERDGRRVRLFLIGELSPDELMLARLGESAPVFDALQRGTTGRPGSIALELGITRHAASYHLKRLVRLGAIRPVERRILVTEARYEIPTEAHA